MTERTRTITRRELDELIAKRRKAEENESREAAKMFLEVCRIGSDDLLEHAANYLSNTMDGWLYAMRGVARLAGVSEDIRRAFLNVYVEHKGLPRTVGNRAVMVKALRVLMPRGYQGAPLRLYRGTDADERRCGCYGFSWTTRREMAREFAENRRMWSQTSESNGKTRTTFDGSAVVLETVAPAEAILLVREPGTGRYDYTNGDFDEDEVIVDPCNLGQVKVIERLKALPPRKKVARPSIMESEA